MVGLGFQLRSSGDISDTVDDWHTRRRRRRHTHTTNKSDDGVEGTAGQHSRATGQEVAHTTMMLVYRVGRVAAAAFVA